MKQTIKNTEIYKKINEYEKQKLEDLKNTGGEEIKKEEFK